MGCNNCTSGYLKNPFRRCDVQPFPEDGEYVLLQVDDQSFIRVDDIPTNVLGIQISAQSASAVDCKPYAYKFSQDDEDFYVAVEEGRISLQICDGNLQVGGLSDNDGNYFGFKLYNKFRDKIIFLRTDGNLCDLPNVPFENRTAIDLKTVTALDDNGYVLVLQNNFLYKARMSLIRKYLSKNLLPNHEKSWNV
jgi:hypothetical protein